jgi:Carboxypeptidase regulatory-like domain
MRKPRFAAGLFALLFAAALAYGRSAEGALDGVVLNGKGVPVAFAQVFWQTADGRAPHAVRANRSGRFRIAGISQGLYEVRGQALGMTSEWEHNVWVPAGRAASVTLRLTHPTRQSGSANKR